VQEHLIPAVSDARRLAIKTLAAAAALIDTRLTAVRHCVDVTDTDIVVNTESLAANAAAWVSQVNGAISVLDQALEPSDLISMETRIAENYRASLSEWNLRIYEMGDSMRAVEADGGEELVASATASFSRDPVFAYLLRRHAKRSDGRFHFVDRLIAKWAKFGEQLANRDRNLAYLDERRAWLEAAGEALADGKHHFDRTIEKLAEARRSVRDLAKGREAAVRRAWNAVVTLLAADAPEFARIDLDAACAVAREATVASLRNGHPSVPFAAEMDERMADLVSNRQDLKSEADKISAMV
jgi:hypothetical protein